MTIKSNSVRDLHAKLNKDITHNWLIIRRENIMEKSAERNYDLKGVLNWIIQKSQQRIKVKLLAQAINTGFKDFAEFKASTTYETIYTLSEKNSFLVQLNQIETLTTSKKKPSKKKDSSIELTEIFSAAKIRAMKKKTELEISALNKKLEEFNESASIEINDKSIADMFAA